MIGSDIFLISIVSAVSSSIVLTSINIFFLFTVCLESFYCLLFVTVLLSVVKLTSPPSIFNFSLKFEMFDLSFEEFEDEVAWDESGWIYSWSSCKG